LALFIIQLQPHLIWVINFPISGKNTRSCTITSPARDYVSKIAGIKRSVSVCQANMSALFFNSLHSKLQEGAVRKAMEAVLSSDDDTEHDAYMERVKNEGKERDEDEDEEGHFPKFFFFFFSL
jgi:hypothetical protein